MHINYFSKTLPYDYASSPFSFAKEMEKSFKMSDRVVNKYKEAAIEQKLEVLRYQREKLDEQIMHYEVQLADISIVDVSETKDHKPTEQ